MGLATLLAHFQHPGLAILKIWGKYHGASAANTCNWLIHRGCGTSGHIQGSSEVPQQISAGGPGTDPKQMQIPRTNYIPNFLRFNGLTQNQQATLFVILLTSFAVLKAVPFLFRRRAWSSMFPECDCQWAPGGALIPRTSCQAYSSSLRAMVCLLGGCKSGLLRLPDVETHSLAVIQPSDTHGSQKFSVTLVCLLQSVFSFRSRGFTASFLDCPCCDWANCSGDLLI